MPKSKKEKIILGIDPGVATTGYGIIKVLGNKNQIIDYGCIITSPQKSFNQRLEKIYKELKKIIKKNKPDKIAVEELFFCKNVKTALKVGQARGVMLLTSIQEKIPLREFTPLQIKQSVTSYGKADKKQVQEMVKIILNLKNIPKPDDAADALAVAICCAHSKF